MNEAPEKIYGWLDSQLSIARFYGGITFRGHSYVIYMADPKQPLVRQDIVKAEKLAERKTKRQLKKDDAEKMKRLFTQFDL